MAFPLLAGGLVRCHILAKEVVDRMTAGTRSSTISASTISASAASGVKAVLGPTNTGKTHLAVERLCAHSSGAIGFPLRLLAREIYDRVCAIARTSSTMRRDMWSTSMMKPRSIRPWMSVRPVVVRPRSLQSAANWS